MPFRTELPRDASSCAWARWQRSPGIFSWSSFDRLMDEAGIRPVIAAEVDDMAMMRLLARETGWVSLVPPVVVRDELKSRSLVELHRIEEIRECFYAITPSRKFPNPLVRELVNHTRKSGR